MDFYEASPFTVDTMPFHAMSGYPYPSNEHYPDDPKHISIRTRMERSLRVGHFRATDTTFRYVPTPSAPAADGTSISK